MRDESKWLPAIELAVVDDPTAKRPALPATSRGPRKPNLKEMGPGVESIPARRRSTPGPAGNAAWVQAQGAVTTPTPPSW